MNKLSMEDISHATTTSSRRQASAKELLTKLLAWYDIHRRTLPWRAMPGSNSNPYHVLVSELMLQQTTVATVQKRFGAFIERFPNIEALANATESDVLHAWQGLGYYRRARALHACARKVIADEDGCLRRDVQSLMTLPGIGAYTAKAIAAIAYDQPVLPVDGNVMRVLSRLFLVETPLPKATGELQELALTFEPCPRPSDTAQAFMDLGATICRPSRPDCINCPWSQDCAAHHEGKAADLPNRQSKRPRPTRHGVAFLLTREDGAVYFRRRHNEGLLGGLHELPSSRWEPVSVDRDEALMEAPIKADWHFHKGHVRHIFTHFVLELELAETTLSAIQIEEFGKESGLSDGLWLDSSSFHELTLPTVMKKLLRQAGRL